MCLFLSKKQLGLFTVPAVLLQRCLRGGLSFLGIISYHISAALLQVLAAVLIASHYAEQVIEICSFLEARTEDEYSIRRGETAL